MAEATTILFPESIRPEIGGYECVPRTRTDRERAFAGRVQRRDNWQREIHSFRYLTQAMNEDMHREFLIFRELRPWVNAFAFYDPYEFLWEDLPIGIADGTGALVVNWRGLATNTGGQLQINGSDFSDFSLAREFTAIKQDKLTWTGTPPIAGAVITLERGYGRRLYTCLMNDEPRRDPYAGGQVVSTNGSVEYPAPVFWMAWDMTFEEVP